MAGFGWFAGVALVWLASTGSGAAQGGVRVALPDVSGLSRAEAESLIAEVAQVTVITSNCPDFPITDGEWTLLAGTGDKLAAQLGLDPTRYEKTYYGPAFALLDDPAACGTIGPRARPLIDRLKGMGGGTDPLP